jgi:hypothetical protein
MAHRPWTWTRDPHASLIGIARWQLVLQKQASFFFASLSTLFGSLLLPPSYELSKVGQQTSQREREKISSLAQRFPTRPAKKQQHFSVISLAIEQTSQLFFLQFFFTFCRHPFLQCSTNIVDSPSRKRILVLFWSRGYLPKRPSVDSSKDLGSVTSARVLEKQSRLQ